MTTTVEKHEVAEPQSSGRQAVWAMPELWGTIAIVSMWMAVLFDGIYGGDFVSANPGSSTTTVPSAVLVAFFAFLATVSVAKRAFRRDGS